MSAPFSANSLANGAAGRTLIRKSDAFRTDVDKRSFAFEHNLVDHPLLQVPRLARLGGDLIRNVGEHTVLCSLADSVPNIRKQWTNFTSSQKIESVIANIDKSGSWIIVKDAQADVEYKALLDELIDELEVLTDRPLRKDITWAELALFIGSPNSVTHYHVDSETNFLFQIHGTKEAHLFDQSDRTILTEEEIEQFYAGNLNFPVYKPETEAKSTVYDFRTGTGIHLPVNAPHWVKNLGEYSVSLSVLLYLRPMDARARTYQFNHLLRRMGLRPVAPGTSAMRDTWKAKSLELISRRTPRTKHEVIHSGFDRLMKVGSLGGKGKAKAK